MTTDTPLWLQLDIEQRPQALLDDVAGSIKISPTIQNLLDLTRRPDSAITPVVETLVKSPSLAAEVLKVANCPIYAHSREICDLRRAVVLIGMQELHAMAAGLSMLAMFSSDNEIAGTMRDTSVVSATIARQLSVHLGEDPVIAFLCGLLCEIGALACNHKDSDGYTDIWKKSNHAPDGRYQLESARYGIPTEATGARLLSLNGLPKSVVEAIRVSYADAATTANTLGKITCFSRFAAYVLVDAGATGSRQILETGIEQLAGHMKISRPPIAQLINLCLEAGLKANLGLQDKTDLYEETLELQNEITQRIRIQVSESEKKRDALILKSTQRKRRRLFVGIGAAIVIIAAVIALLYLMK